MILRSAAKAAALFVLLASAASAGQGQPQPLPIPLNAKALVATDGEIAFEDHLGRRALRIDDGEAVIRDRISCDGLIEFDLALEDRRSFAGINFRRVDARNSERFYLRAHQSGNPDANQYTPVFNGRAGWQIYYGPHHSAPTRYRYGEWMRVRLVMRGDEAEVHLDGEPVLRFALLSGQSCGGIALWTDTAPAWFSNVSASEEPPPFALPPPSPPPVSPDAVLEWEVSQPFPWRLIETVARLDEDWIAGLRWKRLKSEPNGIANLARVADSRGGNTVLARVRVPAERAFAFRFGFSDAVRAYVDGDLAYEGNDTYGTRDYRFLGTVGLHDTLHVVPEGDEVEFVFAVQEGFGGWAVAGAVSRPNSRMVRAE